MKRVVLAAALAAGVFLASPASAGAWCDFCDWDPIVPVITPAGHVVLVYDSVWTSSPLEIGLPLATSTTSRVYDEDGNPETLVTTNITVPTGLLFGFPTLDMVTTGPLGSGQVLARAYGTSGRTTTLTFRLHEA